MEHPPSEADLRVLDAALDEELDGLAPPDLWPRVQAALVAGGANAAALPRAPGAGERRRSRRRFWFAIAMAAASAVVVGVWLDRGNNAGSGDRAPLLPARTSPPLDVDAKGPLDLAELQRWLAAGGLRDATIRAENVFAPALGRTVPLATYPLEGFFEGVTTVHLRFAERAELAAALQRALTVALPRTARPWEHAVDLSLDQRDRRARLLVRSDADAALHFAVAAPGGAFGVALDGLAALLEPELREVTAATVAARGIAIGDAGFDALPATATRLRLHDVSRAAAARIGRFAALRSLDLRDAPDWHEARVVRALAALPLQTLWIDGSRLDEAGVAALEGFTQLRELFVLGPGEIFAQILTPSPPVLPRQIAATLAQLPQLEELLLVDGGFADRDLAQLARIGTLQRLTVFGSARMDGSGLTAFTGRSLRSLGLGSTRALDLAPLTGWRALEELVLQGPVPRSSLAAMRAIPGLEKLTLMPVPALAADDLPALYGATRLRHLGLFGADALDENARAALRAALPACRMGFDPMPQ